MRGRKRYNKRILIALALVALLLSLLLLQILGVFSSSAFGRAFTYRTLGNQNHAEVFHFQGQAASTVSVFDNGIALVGHGGLQVYNRAGNLVYFAESSLQNPVLQVNDTNVLAYDLGGFDVLIGNRRELIHHHHADGRIIDAYINANGWLTLSMEQIGTLGVIHVIDPNGNLRYAVELGTGHVISAKLADDNRTLAVLSMTTDASRVFWYDINQHGAPLHSVYRMGELVFDFWFTNANGSLALLSDHAVIHYTNNGSLQRIYHFEGRHLRGFDTHLGRAVIYLGQGQVGTRGELILFETNGNTRHLPVVGTLQDLSLNGRFVALLLSEELILYRNLREYATLERLELSSGILAREDGSIITVSASRAQIRIP